MPDHDLVVRNGTIADGSGAPLRTGDIAIRDGRIVAVGTVPGTGAEEIDAGGKLVTPGFVDIHTHYDAQVTWDTHFSPSTSHGVTTVLMGNCGVGFAPCRPEQRDEMIDVMEVSRISPASSWRRGCRGTGKPFPISSTRSISGRWTPTSPSSSRTSPSAYG